MKMQMRNEKKDETVGIRPGIPVLQFYIRLGRFACVYVKKQKKTEKFCSALEKNRKCSKLMGPRCGRP